MMTTNRARVTPVYFAALLIFACCSFVLAADDVGTFYHMPDIHYDDAYEVGSDAKCFFPMCCRSSTDIDGSTGDPAGPAGEPKCDLPSSTVVSALKFVASKNPDFVLNTGDLIAHDLWNQTQDIILTRLNLSAQLMVQNLRNGSRQIPLFNIFGDHDTFPFSTFGAPGEWDWLVDSVATKIWSPFFASANESAVFQNNGGYYSRVVNGTNLRLIGMNIMYGATRNIFAVAQSDDLGGQLAWLTNELQATRTAKQRAIILGHMPYGISEYEVLPAILPAYMDKLTEVFTSFSDVIEIHLAGHVHVDSFRIVRGSGDQCLGVQLLSPSVTTWSNLNPTVREFKYHRTNGSIFEINTYVLNFTAVNEGKPYNWTLQYSLPGEYKLPDLKCNSWESFRKNLKSDDTTWKSFMRNYWSLYDTEDHRNSVDDEEFRRSEVCQIGFPNYNAYLQCIIDSVIDDKFPFQSHITIPKTLPVPRA